LFCVRKKSQKKKRKFLFFIKDIVQNVGLLQQCKHCI